MICRTVSSPARHLFYNCFYFGDGDKGVGTRLHSSPRSLFEVRERERERERGERRERTIPQLKINLSCFVCALISDLSSPFFLV